MKQFTLIGPNAGETITLGGFNFVNGRVDVPEEDAAKVASFLAEYFSAYPSEEAATRQAEYEQTQSEAKATLERQQAEARAARKRELERELAKLKAAEDAAS